MGASALQREIHQKGIVVNPYGSFGRGNGHLASLFGYRDD
jgi:hypothetical protein